VPSFLVLNLWLVRELPQLDYAVYAVALIMVAFLSVAVTLGMPPTMVRILRESLTQGAVSRVRAGIRYCYLWTAVACLLVPLAYLALIPWFGAGHLGVALRQYAPWIITWICLAGFTQLTAEVFRGLEDFRWSAILSGQNGGMAPNLSVLIIVVVASYLRPLELRFVFAAQLVATALPLLWGLWKLGRTSSSLSDGVLKPLGPFTDLRPLTPARLLRESSPLLAAHCFAVCLTHVDVFLLAGFAPSDEVAIYGAIRRLMALVAAPILLANVVLPSFVVDLHAQQRKQEMERLLRSTATLAGIPALLVLIVLLIWPQQLLVGLFGSEYASGSTALVILTLAHVVFVMCGSSDLALIMTGRQGQLLRVTLLTGVTYLALSPWFIARYGMQGAALASGLLIVAHNVLSMASVRRYVGVWSAASASPRLIRDSLRWVWRGGVEACRGS
jgi:O-antigen/teichoic acid export membrane protein